MFSRYSTISIITATLLMLPGPAVSGGGPSADSSSGPMEELIVTGTSKARASADTPFAVTDLDEEQLRNVSFNSQADILRLVPGIKAEGGGGEVASNVFIKGLPSGGQYQFTPLLYDGMPAFATFGLNSSAFDVYYRHDLGVERMEFVRGGVTNLFGPGSVAGIVNYISKTGGDERDTQVQLEYAEEDRYRADFAASGPLSSNGLYYATSGYYRNDEGPLDSGLPTNGYQVRGNIRKDFADGSGSFTLYGQLINDQVQFFLPLPLDGSSRERTSGNDGSKVYTVQTAEAQNINFQTPDGTYRTAIRDAVSTDGGMIGFAFDNDMGNGWGLNGRGKYSVYEHQFNLFLDGDGVINSPETQDAFLTNRGLPAGGVFTSTRTGMPLPSNFLLFPNRVLDRNRPATDYSGELNLTKVLDGGGFSHTLTFGTFFSRSEADDDNNLYTYLAEFNDKPGLVDLAVVATDGSLAQGSAAGDTVIISNKGLLNAGVGWSNNTLSAQRIAGYIADQMESDRWIIDVGVRFERISGDINKETSESFFVGQAAAGNLPAGTFLGDDLQTVTFGNGGFDAGSVSTSDWAGALGVLFKLTDAWNLYGNVSRGFFFPQLRSVGFNPVTGNPAPYEPETISQVEVGVKWLGESFSTTAGVFFNELEDRENVDFVNDGMGGVIEQTFTQSTESTGIEVTGSWLITDYLTLDGNVTFQDAEFTKVENNPALVGNEPRRQPNWLANLGLFFNMAGFDAGLFANYVGDNFANDSNTVKLDSFTIWRLNAGYTFAFEDDSQLRLSVDVFNLTDDEGITEGSPRQGANQSSAGAFFIGRPILPRRTAVRLNYRF